MEVRQTFHVRVADRRQHLARTRPLKLHVRQRLRDRLDPHAEVAHDLLEVIEVGVERGNHPYVLAEVEDRAVSDHLPLRIAERRISNLPHVETQRVVREDPVGGTQGIRAAEVPFPERRFVPDADALSDRAVFSEGVSEVVRPEPALPVHELAAELPLDGVERRVHELRAHVSAACATSALQPSSSETACVCSSNGSTAESIASRSKRDAGP